MVFVGPVVTDVSIFGLGSMFCAVFLSLVIRFSCRVSDFVMGGCNVLFASVLGGCANGHIVWAKW